MKFLNNMDGASRILEDSSHRFVTDAEKAAWNAKQAAITGAASSVVSTDLDVFKAVVTDGYGKLANSATTAMQITYLNTLTGNVQTQLNGKAASDHNHALGSLTGISLLSQFAGHVLYYDGTEWRNTTPSGAGLQTTITGGATSIASANLTASRALISDASGKVAVSAVTSTEIGYLDGVTSAIQTQLNGKAASSHTHSYLPLTGGTLTGSLTLNNADVSGEGILYANAGKITSSAITKTHLETFFQGHAFTTPFETILYGLATYGELYDLQQLVLNEYSHYTHTHNYLPTTGGSLSGILNLTVGSAIRQLNMGSLYTGQPGNVGAIWIDIGLLNIMFNTKINIRSYNYLVDMAAGGYTYTSTQDWHSTHATGESSNGPLNIRFATDGIEGRRYIIIGDSNTDWGGYLHVTVDDATVGYGVSFSSAFSIYLRTYYPSRISRIVSIGGLPYHTHSIADISLLDHTSSTSPNLVGVIMGTGNPPTASSVPQGTIYLKYV